MKRIRVKLNTKSIQKAIDELTDYKNSLGQKNKLFVERLIDLGIQVAQQNATGIGKYITFSKEVDGNTHCVGYLIATDSKKIMSMWETKEGVRGAEVSPSLMAEFGSGKYAEVLFPIDGVGRGTFPGQTHAFENVWHWMDLDGKWHSSSGLKPTHPMYHADMEMITQIEQVAKEVFSNDL